MINQQKIEKYKKRYEQVSDQLSQVYQEMSVVDQQPASAERADAFDALLTKKMKMEMLLIGVREKVESLLARV